MMYRWVLLCAAGGLVASLLVGCAQPRAISHSADSEDSRPNRMLAKGNTETDEWLQIQREGSQASSTPQRLSDQERELANQRWLDSFTHPIPDFYERDAGGGFSED
ncbi:DUF3613 domain-containing protein [Halomonas sp. SpR8]|uniref:DUF3613 domain-containing protein n=1 Tax=Halomonas sp. SpR8 TaxID=3050463 RepID=UPI0027E4E9EB|nr:DUF3613 domain-containing protein [Halomonas sp. SpR8]MDQ7728159.1 DUF3613 domain-containing protein [Halomonas sp. SpR8]